MAIIKCPECEEKVSTEAKKCIHCGCEFTVCQECGTVFVGKPTVCSECGYTFTKKENSSNENISEKSETGNNKGKASKGLITLTDVQRQWKNECGKNILKVLKYFVMAISVICLVFVAFQFITVNKWELFQYDDKMTLITVLIGIMCIMDICKYMIMRVGDFYFTLKMPTWLESKKIDLNTPTIQYLQNLKKQSNDFSIIEQIHIEGDLHNIYKSLALKDDYNVKNQFIIFKIIEIVLKAISSGFIWSFIILNVRNITGMCFLMGIKNFFTEVFSFSGIEYWWLLIVGIVVAIIKSFYNFVIETKEDTSIDNWFHKNYSEYFEK